ncbi:MAG: ABC transporter permease, partial [Devosia sp.]
MTRAPAARRITLALLLAPLVLWLGLLVVIPHIDMLVLSFTEKTGVRQYQPGLANYRTFFVEPVYWTIFLRTALMSILATLLTLVIGFPVAYFIAKLARGRSKAFLFLLCLVPFWVSELVRTFGWMILLRETGLVSGALQALGVVTGPV